MNYIILSARNAGVFLKEIIEELPEDVKHYLKNCKFIYLSLKEIKNRYDFENELVIIDPLTKDTCFFINQWAKNSNRYFIMTGMPMHTFMSNLVGYFNNKEQLKDNLIHYYRIVCSKKLYKVNKNVSLYLSEITYVKIKDRHLMLFTSDRTYKMGYVTLKSFVEYSEGYFVHANRNVCVNVDHIYRVGKDQSIVMDGVHDKIQCSKSRFKTIQSKLNKCQSQGKMS